MEAHVFALVLFGAACHASWNAVIKIGLDPLGTTTLIALGSMLVAIPLVPFVGMPAAESWPWLAVSLALHVSYFVSLTEAYRAGDMGQVYPIARGTAPLLTAIVSAAVLGERVGMFGWAGIFALVGGVFLMSMRGSRDLARMDRRAVGFAFFTAVNICAYSVVDGIGARLAGSAHAYSVMLFLLDGIALPLLTLLLRGPGLFAAMPRFWLAGLAGGALSFASYAIMIWAMTVAPIAMVATLRETSVLFAAAIAVVVLKEKLRPARIAAALLIVTGLMLLRVS